MARRHSPNLYIRGLAAGLVAVGCSDTGGQQTGLGLDGSTTSTLGSTTGAPTGTTSVTSAGVTSAAVTGSSTSAGGATAVGTVAVTSAGVGTTIGAVSSTSSSTSSGPTTGITAGVGGSTTGGEHTVDHCLMGYEPEATDTAMADGPAPYTENGQTDATVQPEVIAWMEKHAWQEAHFQWHQVRRCGGGAQTGQGVINPCEYPEMLPEANECENAQDGYEFLVMHRHMINSLKQLWPNHTEQFEGWDHFPAAEDYPEIVREYYTQWSAQVLADAAIADNIADNMDRFANEGEFGMWLQCGSLQGGLGASGSLHGSLHFNGYPQNNQSHSIANQRRNLDGYLFWKLHGWIDKVWERYRVANGQAPDEPKLKDELIAQCREMDALSALIDPSLAEPDDPTELPEEAGFFHEVVRPGLENFGCATCHGEGEEAGLRLGYNVSSADIVAGLVNVDSAYAVGYKLVVPGDPDRSWLYLKASGLSTSSGATCQGVATCTKRMPPRGDTFLPDADLANLRQWILDGAPAPTAAP